MRRFPAPLIPCILALAMSAPLAAQTYVVRRLPSGPTPASQTIRYDRAVYAGQAARIWWATMLNADCSPSGTMDVRIEEQPRHGTLTVDDGPVYPSFPQYNPRVRCDVKQVPGKEAFYTAAAGFHGHDKIILRNATSDGRMRRVVIDIAVS